MSRGAHFAITPKAALRQKARSSAMPLYHAAPSTALSENGTTLAGRHAKQCAKADPSRGGMADESASRASSRSMWGYLRVFRMLCRYGHTGQKAAEIILDATRGDQFSRNYIRYVRKWSH